MWTVIALYTLLAQQVRNQLDQVSDCSEEITEGIVWRIMSKDIPSGKGVFPIFYELLRSSHHP